jgi:hypothetical protein
MEESLDCGDNSHNFIIFIVLFSVTFSVTVLWQFTCMSFFRNNV